MASSQTCTLANYDLLTYRTDYIQNCLFIEQLTFRTVYI